MTNGISKIVRDPQPIRLHSSRCTLANSHSSPPQSTSFASVPIIKMQVLSTVLFLASVTSGLVTPPTTQLVPTTYVELHSEKVANGTLIYLGPPEGSNEARDEASHLEERDNCAKAPAITCDNDHTARNDLCEQLVTDLIANGGVPVGSAPRQICFKGDGSKNNHCCVSWSDKIDGLKKGQFADAALAIQGRCTENGISGLQQNNKINGKCVTVCLSGRGTGCH